MIALVIISGRSGSGKSTALHVLEDMGYYCIDNLPVSLLPPLVKRLADNQQAQKISVSIDARNIASDLANFPTIMEEIDAGTVNTQIVYLDAASTSLVNRFSETRRKHPLTSAERNLGEALELETELLEPISSMAALTIDTTTTTIHELRDLIKSRVANTSQEFALLFESFAFKNGVPVDSDLVFDVRCLPNPHWKPNLQPMTGLDAPVVEFLEEHDDVEDMYNDIKHYLEVWLPRFEASNRAYMTVAIGCTGGQHRSVYMARRLYDWFAPRRSGVQLRHREMGKAIARQESLNFEAGQ